MSTITIAPGQTGYAQAGDELIYPDVSSGSLTITTVLRGAWARCGGYVVNSVGSGQMDLHQIVDYELDYLIGDCIIVAGDVQWWNDNWGKNSQTFPLMIRGSRPNNLLELFQLMGFQIFSGANQNVWVMDTNQWGTGPYTLYFDPSGALYGKLNNAGVSLQFQETNTWLIYKPA